MLNNFKELKNKNIKIQNRKLELSGYRFDMEYRPGKLNSAANALSRNPKAKKVYGQVNSISIRDNLLEKVHRDLGCPGTTRLFHQVKIRSSDLYCILVIVKGPLIGMKGPISGAF